MKKFTLILLALSICIGLTGCKPNNQEPDVTPSPTTSVTDNPVDDTYKYMLVDTEDYELTFDILGGWTEYAGNSSIRDMSKAVLTTGEESTNSDSIFFYVLIDKYENTEDISIKDKIIEDIKANFSSIEFESINDSSTEESSKVISIYTASDGNQTIKNYQYTIIKDGYEISFIYSAPSLMYNSQKGYINDMIDSSKFSLKENTKTTK